MDRGMNAGNQFATGGGAPVKSQDRPSLAFERKILGIRDEWACMARRIIFPATHPVRAAARPEKAICLVWRIPAVFPLCGMGCGYEGR